MKTKLAVALSGALIVVACAKQVQKEVPTRQGNSPSAQEQRRLATTEEAYAPADLERIEVTGSRIREHAEPVPRVLASPTPMSIPAPPPAPVSPPAPPADYAADELHIAATVDGRISPLQIAADTPFSTFSIDVDTGSYSQARQALSQGRMPAPQDVRTEEFLNYFDYRYPMPRHLGEPFAVSTELADSPWNAGTKLLQIGIQGFPVEAAHLPPANLVFLIDTSGSMHSPDKLPLLKAGFRGLVGGLRAQDRVAIVTYAGSAGLALPSTPGNQRETILAALDRLEAGGSTHGSAGIDLAYRTAAQSMIKGGVNRVILATDGDFNVGTTSVEALKELVAGQREGGVALTTLGFGSWGYNGTVAEQLADVGNGHHAFIDDDLEAHRVLVEQMGGTLLTIAKDVKIQLEFNRQLVHSYRLLGYENRALRREDFANDKIDAGEIGAGHSVTAIYEITPATAIASNDQLATLRIRYKAPQGDTSRLIEQPVRGSAMQPWASERLQFALAVAGFAEKLRGSPALQDFGYDDVMKLLDQTKQGEFDAAREELHDLVKIARELSAGP